MLQIMWDVWHGYCWCYHGQWECHPCNLISSAPTAVVTRSCGCPHVDYFRAVCWTRMKKAFPRPSLWVGCGQKTWGRRIIIRAVTAAYFIPKFSFLSNLGFGMWVPYHHLLCTALALMAPAPIRWGGLWMSQKNVYMDGYTHTLGTRHILVGRKYNLGGRKWNLGARKRIWEADIEFGSCRKMNCSIDKRLVIILKGIWK